MSKRILTVDDEPRYLRLLEANLKTEGYTVVTASDGLQALEVFSAQPVDLVLLDIMMPRLDGFGTCQRIREFSNVPIIMLTAKGEEQDRVKGLDLGADDYLVKPFSATELLARVRAVLRRSQSGQPSLSTAWRLSAGELTIDRRARRATLNGQLLDLSPKAFAVLEYLMTHPDEVVSRERLLQLVWGWEYPVGTRTVDTRMFELRKALGDDPAEPKFIETHAGEGYCFIAPVRMLP